MALQDRSVVVPMQSLAPAMHTRVLHVPPLHVVPAEHAKGV